MAILGGKSPDELSVTNALMNGFRMVTQVNFVIPILVIGIVVNLVVLAAVVPIIIGIALPAAATTTLGIGAIIASILGAVVAAIVGGLLLNLYGQVWATMASVGEAPTMQAAFARLGERWMSILGAGIIVGGVSLGIILGGGLLAALLGGLGVVILIVAAIVTIYVGARLSMSGWLAADGAAAMDAVKTSWAMTNSRLLLIIGWGLAFGIVYGIIGSILTGILENMPGIGPAVAQTIISAFGFGAGVSLYRKVKGS